MAEAAAAEAAYREAAAAVTRLVLEQKTALKAGDAPRLALIPAEIEIATDRLRAAEAAAREAAQRSSAVVREQARARLRERAEGQVAEGQRLAAEVVQKLVEAGRLVRQHEVLLDEAEALAREAEGAGLRGLPRPGGLDVNFGGRRSRLFPVPVE